MGKGDKRTRKGKIFAASFGKSRPQNKKKVTPPKSQAANAPAKETDK